MGRSIPLNEILPVHIPGSLGSPYHGIVSITEKWGPLWDGRNSPGLHGWVFSWPQQRYTDYWTMAVRHIHCGVATADGFKLIKSAWRGFGIWKSTTMWLSWKTWLAGHNTDWEKARSDHSPTKVLKHLFRNYWRPWTRDPTLTRLYKWKNWKVRSWGSTWSFWDQM